MNPLCNILNYSYIQQQSQQQHYQEQTQQVLESIHKLQDFLDSADKVEPAYRDALTAACCTILLAYAQKHHIII